MPRDGEKVRRRLQEAALELFRERGYEHTTAAQIAGRAGVTERTFFRHFPDKREVLFDGESALCEILVGAIAAAPPSVGAWDTLLRAFAATKPLLIEKRPFAEPRCRLIASRPDLQERDVAKTMALTGHLANALRTRGVPDRQASLAAQMGMAAFGQAFFAWLENVHADFDVDLAQAFRDVRDLVAG